MPYNLSTIILPQPKKLTREIIETGVEHLLIYGKTTKRTENRKERFTLEYQYLTQAQINSILSIYRLDTIISFSVNETNLVIAETDVLIDIQGLEYPPSAKEYRENMTIVLTETL